MYNLRVLAGAVGVLSGASYDVIWSIINLGRAYFIVDGRDCCFEGETEDLVERVGIVNGETVDIFEVRWAEIRCKIAILAIVVVDCVNSFRQCQAEVEKEGVV